MQIKKRKIIIILLLMPLIALSQQKGNPSLLLKQAIKEYKIFKYTPAIQLLDKVLKEEPNNIIAKELIANSYRKNKDYAKATYWYEQLIRANSIKPEWALGYAEVLVNLNKHTQAEEWHKKYLSIIVDDSYANINIKIDPFLKRNLWKVGYTSLNTAALEYSPTFYKEGLIFSSNRGLKTINKYVFEADQTPFTDLYYVDKLSDIKQLDPDSMLAQIRNESVKYKNLYKFNDDDTYAISNVSKTLIIDTLGLVLSTHHLVKPLPKEINSKCHEGSAVVLADGSLIFTQNNFHKGKTAKSNEGVNKLKLYTALAPNWKEIQEFPFNSNKFSCGHPAINKAGTILIFSSDMPGGFGGADLYYSKRTSITDKWTKPVNLGKAINTKGDEMFPVIYQDTTLFFSSTEHAGLGGLDIFQIAINGIDIISKPLNLGYPINSSLDDFGLIRTEEGNNGYFTSNRRGNDDIYSFIYHDFKIKLKGKVVDLQNGNPLASKINYTINGNKTTLTTKNDGTFELFLEKESTYNFLASKDGYTNKVDSVTTNDIIKDTTLTVLLKLSKAPAKQILASTPSPSNCDSLKNQLNAFRVYYDLDKSFIRKDADEVMQKLSLFLKANPKVNIVAASHCDSRASNSYNNALSLKRSTTVKNYLVSKGISENRIKIQYYGESKLINACKDGVICTEEQQQLNRRTEFYFSIEGKKLEDIDCKLINNFY